MRVFVTGSASHLAEALLPILCEDSYISEVMGLDLRPTNFTHPRFQQTILDIRTATPKAYLSGYDAVIHLAWVVLRGSTPLNVMRGINIDASQRWLSSAAELGINKIIHLSSASVYGRGTHINEQAPLTPITGFYYAEHKAELEHWLIRHHPQVVRLRPHIILGEHAQPLLKQILRLPFYPKLSDPQPLLQCIHEQDVAHAILNALKRPVQGAYNLAASNVFSLRDAIQWQTPRAIPIPFVWAKMSLQFAWKTTGYGGEPGWLSGANQSLTLDCSKAQHDLAWTPHFTPQDILAKQVRNP